MVSEAAVALVAAHGCCEPEEGQVVARMAFVAWGQAAVAGEPAHRAFDDPASASESLAGLDALAGDAHPDALTAKPFPQVGDAVGLAKPLTALCPPGNPDFTSSGSAANRAPRCAHRSRTTLRHRPEGRANTQCAASLQTRIMPTLARRFRGHDPPRE